MKATPRLRPVLLAGAAAAVLTLSACSGLADDAPTDADPQAFCGAFYDETVTARDAAAKLAEVGTPTDVSSAERKGFELWVEGLDNEGDTPNSEIETVNIPADDEDDGKAFIAYVGDTCLTSPTSGAPEPTPAPTEPASPESS